MTAGIAQGTRFGPYEIAGKSIVFDRMHPNFDIVLIDVPKPGGVPPGPARR